MIEIIKNKNIELTRSIEVVYFPNGNKAYAIFENNEVVKWLFSIDENGKLERF